MIGLGIMGSAMASNLVKAGFRVIGYDVVSKARRAHKRAGGVAARSNGDVARRTNIVVTSPPVTLAAWPSDDRRSRLVFIIRGIDEPAVPAVFAAVGLLQR
jgi:pyrroline-5-carboxylate reductase